jgi:hypothetical protein
LDESEQVSDKDAVAGIDGMDGLKIEDNTSVPKSVIDDESFNQDDIDALLNQ